MAKTTYTVIDRDYKALAENENYSSADLRLIENYQINKNYDPSLHYIETHFYSINDNLIFSLYDYNISSDLELNADGGITDFTLQPEKIGIENGFVGVDHKVVFHFLNDLYTINNSKLDFYINSISQDRKEILLFSDKLDVNRLINITEDLKEKIKSENYFEEFWLNLGDNDLFIVTNIDVYELDNKYTVALKLYEPLPDKFQIKDEVQIVEKISDSVMVEVQVEVEDDPELFPTLRAANFNIELDTDDTAPTEYYNYDELFSFSNLNSNREIFSYLSEKSVNINIDYSDYNNYINFSSAQERLKNFKYKVQLLQTYESSKNQITNSANASGSSAKYDQLIKGVVDNFDHYERYLYYESGSNAWPKSTSVKPHVNLHTTSSEGISWYSSQLTSASNYDTSNYDVLTNTLPSYIAEDTKNNSAVLFIHMIGQHFDNLWIYSKAVTDKYDNDNRLNTGISKDLVRDVLKGFGVKIHNSVEGSNDLFKYLIADTYDSGSVKEVVNNFLQVPNIPSDSQPISRQDYEGELYKRIYHNLPYLMKTKGTERGLRALINCFGIPSSFLEIREYGGDIIGKSKFIGYEEEKTSVNKVRTESRASGSVGKVLTANTSIQKKENDRVQDIHRLEVGFSPADEINRYILSQVSSSFDIDEYLGDPRDTHKTSYDALYKFTENILISIPRYELNDFVRILKFFDNVLFKMIKDFVPASSTLDTGIIIKPHVLDRSKAKTPEMSGTRPEYTASIDTAFVTGSDGGTYVTGKQNLRKLKEIEAYWPQKVGGISNFTFKPDFSNPTTENDGEIVVRGTEYYHPDGTLYTFPDNHFYGTVYTPYEGSVSSDFNFYLMFTSESAADRFGINNGSGGSSNLTAAHPHIVPIDYSPHGQNSWVVRDNLPAISSSFTPLANDVIIAAATLEADTDKISYFVNYTDSLNTVKPGFKTTIYKEDIRTKSGSVSKWHDDDAEKVTGELSGSYIEVTDGELNDENIFKQVNVPVLNFDIIAIDEGSANNYTAFNIDVDVFNDATASCASAFSGVQRFHSGTGTTPAVGDFVFNDASGNATFNIDSAAKWYKIQDGKSILIQGTSAGSNQGKVTEVADCSQFDSTAPTGYTATWNLSSGKINANNKTAVPFLIYDGELDATFEVTASRESGGTEKKITGTITNAVTQSGTIDLTTVPDGDNILLDVRLVDGNGNVGAFATNKGNVTNDILNTLTASIKDTVSPTITSVDFKTNNSYSVSATATNTNGILYIRVAGMPNNERGSINMTISSTGGGTSFTDTRGYNNTSTYTANQDYLLSTFQHGLSNGTLTVTVNLTDFAGNNSINYTDSLVMNVQQGSLLTSTSKNSSSGNHYIGVSVNPTTISWRLEESVSWAYFSSATGTGNTYKYLYFNSNSSSNSRSVTVTLKNTSNSAILATKTITQAGTYNSCVAPHTLILMSDGSYKTAGRLSVGDEIKTKQENTLEEMNALIYEKKSSHSKRIKVFIGDKDIVVSPAHRFYVDNRSEFVAAEDLKEGDILSGKNYVKTEEYEDGEVLQISVEKAHTYISNDILSHNTKGVNDYDS